MNDIIGWIGSMTLAFSALPQVFMSYKNKNSNGLSWLFLAMWGIGEIFGLIYLCNLPITSWPLIANYVLNLSMWGVIFYYKIIGHPSKKW